MKIFAILLLIFAATLHARDLEKIYRKADLQIGAQKISAYIADTEQGREEGLMFVKNLPVNTGMLFVFEEERPLAFWMKNTLIPLAIGYFDARGVLIDIQEMRVANSIVEARPPAYPSKGPALFALEMPKGWFAEHKIKTGSRLERLAKTPSKILDEKLPLIKSARH